MPKKDDSYKVKGELYRNEDGRLMVLEDKTGVEVDLEKDIEEYIGRQAVTITVKESKEI